MSDHSCNIYYDHSKNAGVKSEKYIVHFIIWGLGVISYYILDKTTAGDEFQNISLLLIGCLMFYAVYYISMISEIKKIECELNESGIFGGRGMGILINMFSLQYIFELYKKPLVCIVLIVVSVIVLILSRKYIKSFWTKIYGVDNFYLFLSHLMYWRVL